MGHWQHLWLPSPSGHKLLVQCLFQPISHLHRDRSCWSNHALRHTFVTNLYKSGVSPKVIQSLARHSTIGLTMDTYTHIGLYDERVALDKLPELPDMDGKEGNHNRDIALKTGTDNLPIIGVKSVYKEFAENAYSGLNQSSLFGTTDKLMTDDGKQNTDNHKPLVDGMLGTKKEPMSLIDTGLNRQWAGLDSN